MKPYANVFFFSETVRFISTLLTRRLSSGRILGMVTELNPSRCVTTHQKDNTKQVFEYEIVSNSLFSGIDVASRERKGTFVIPSAQMKNWLRFKNLCYSQLWDISIWIYFDCMTERIKGTWCQVLWSGEKRGDRVMLSIRILSTSWNETCASYPRHC